MNAVTGIVVAFQENKRGCWRCFWGGAPCKYPVIMYHRSPQTPNIASPEGHLCPPGKAGSPSWGCAVPGLAELWVLPGMEVPQWYLITHMLKKEIVSAPRAPRSHRSGFITHLPFVLLLFWVPLSHSILQQEVLVSGPVWRTPLKGFNFTC